MGESAPFWRFSAASYPDLEDARPVDIVLQTAEKTSIRESDTSVKVCQFTSPLHLVMKKMFPFSPLYFVLIFVCLLLWAVRFDT